MKKILPAICCAVLWFCAPMTFAQSAAGTTTTTTRLDGAQPVISSLPASIQNPAFSPDGTSIIYTMFHAGYNDGPAGIFICAAAGGSGGTPLIDEEGNDSVNLPGMSWNRNSSLITFASDRAGPDEIWTMAADGSKRTRVTHHPPPGYYIEPSFSPDGGWIVFEADTEAPDSLQQGSIYKVSVNGTGQVKLTDGPANGTDDRLPNWSPTGESILFQRRLPGSENWDIYTINPDGTNLKQVTSTESSDTDASFSPDGKWIVYSTDYGGLEVPNIFIIPATGGSPIRITKNENNEDGAPSWSPDGKWIAFESHPGADEDTSASIWRIPVSIPVPLITANNIADAVTVDIGKTVTISLNLHAGFAGQQPADWWIIHLDPQREVESFDLNTMSFRPGFFPTYQGDLLSFSSIPLPVLSTLSVGNHHFYFAIDLLTNGQLDAESLFYSGISVFSHNAGSEHPGGGSKAVTTFLSSIYATLAESPGRKLPGFGFSSVVH